MPSKIPISMSGPPFEGIQISIDKIVEGIQISTRPVTNNDFAEFDVRSRPAVFKQISVGKRCFGILGKLFRLFPFIRDNTARSINQNGEVHRAYENSVNRTRFS